MNQALAVDRQVAKAMAQAWMDPQFCQRLMNAPASLLAETGITAADFMKLASQTLNIQQVDDSVTIPAKPADLIDASLNTSSEQVVPFSFCRGCCS